MDKRCAVGFIGVGLMGWGMAKNIVEKGWPLKVVAHKRREAIDDLVGRGAQEVADIATLVSTSEVIILCVTGAVQVEQIVGDILAQDRARRRCHTIIDSSTSRPALSLALAARCALAGIDFLDAPLSRTPAHTWSGEAVSFLGGSDELRARWRPLVSCWADVIIEIPGAIGNAHAAKLVNNMIGIASAAVWSEAYALLEGVGLAPEVLREMIGSSGLNCGNFQNFSKYICDGDSQAHKFTLVNCLKDLGYCCSLADDKGAPTLMAGAAHHYLKLAQSMGLGERYMPELVDVPRRLGAAVGGGGS